MYWNNNEAHAELMFGDFDRSDFLVVGSGDYQKQVRAPKDVL